MLRVKGTFEVEFEEEWRELLDEEGLAVGLRLMLENELFPGYQADTVEVEFIG